MRCAASAALALGMGAITASSAAADPSVSGPSCHAYYVSLGAHLYGGFENAVDVVSGNTFTVQQGQQYVRDVYCASS